MSTSKFMLFMFLTAILTFSAVYATAVFENLWIFGSWFIVLVIAVIIYIFILPTRRQ
ncbi:hypothetical protein [Kurthia senegalensis]|uniref:hypothetical protein n=1 Tax=Kurthia senegalensis TaxID=1033740 RepID=UPI0012B5DF17|nr:hypothetical protein [Kurthia senegalensis]